MSRPTTKGFFVKERLTEAREARGLNKKDLADLIGKSGPTISNWERGEQAPEPATLDTLAKTLNVFPSLFISSLPEHGSCPIFFRSLANASSRARIKEHARVRWLQRISLVLQELLDFPEVDLPDLTQGSNALKLRECDLEQIALDLRAHWGLGDAPIKSMVLVAENAGIVVGVDDVGSTSIDGQANWSLVDGKPYILLARDKYTAFRRQMDVAHEMAHLLLHKNITETDLEQNFALIEHQAKYFAGAFLMPARSFTMEIRSLSLEGFLSLKERWMVAIGAMIKRSEQLEILSAGAAQQLWKYRSARGWHRREPLDLPSDTPVEEPRLLRRSIEMIVDAKVRSKKELLEIDIGLGAEDVEMLASMPPGYFNSEPAPIVRLEPKLRSPAGDGFSADVLPFRRSS